MKPPDLGQKLLAVEDAGLYEDNQLWGFGQGRDVDPQNLHPELPVTVPHGDGEHPLMVFLVDGQLLVGACRRPKVREADRADDGA